MSLQDDYFELKAKLKGNSKKQLERIWEAFVQMENEHEALLQIRGAVRRMVELTFNTEETK